MAEIFKKTEKCPSCGSEKRVLGPLFQELAKDKTEAFRAQLPPGMQMQSPLQFAMNVLMTKIPVLSLTFDICADCHTMYAVTADLIDAPVRVEMQKPPAEPPLQKRQGFPFNSG